MKKKNYTIWLVITYVVMAAVCATLIIMSKQDLTSIIINIAMFVVVAVIFGYAISKFKIASKLQEAFYEATKKIKEDAKSDNKYLWENYKKEKGNGIFTNDVLTSQYQKFVTEMKRLELEDNSEYICDISDFINKEYVDSLMKKNIMNLVPGTMTGLGILGTFVGLSFGLQYFNTGTAAEITESISPLMEGIKVAFHTSVYGMVFSLVFNFIYKAMFEAVYVQLDEFTDAFDTYVLGDSANDNESRTMELLQAIPREIGNNISDQISKTLAPVIVNINKAMMDFAQTMSETQQEGLKGMANEFVECLNQSTGEAFTKLGFVVHETCEIQKQNNAYAETVMSNLANVAANVTELNNMSVGIIENMAGYANVIENLHSLISENYSRINTQSEILAQHDIKMQSYVDMLADSNEKLNADIQSQLENAVQLFNESAGQLESAAANLSSMLASTRSEIEAAGKELSVAATGLDDKLKKSLDSTFEAFDSNMAQITGHLSVTVADIKETTERVPGLILSACEGMQASFDNLESKINNGNR